MPEKDINLKLNKPVKILVVDDHSLTRRGILSILKEHNPVWKVFEAEDGVKAALIARDIQPEIILLDYNMPRLDGIKTATLIRKASPDSKIIIVSMETNPDVMIETVKTGVVGIVSKHSYDDELIVAIDDVKKGTNHLPENVTVMINDQPANKQVKKKYSKQDQNKLLSSREEEIFEYLIKGMAAESIAQIFDISYRTVNNHKTSIFKKCKVNSTPELIRYAFKKKLLKSVKKHKIE